MNEFIVHQRVHDAKYKPQITEVINKDEQEISDPET